MTRDEKRTQRKFEMLVLECITRGLLILVFTGPIYAYLLPVEDRFQNWIAKVIDCIRNVPW